MTKTVSKVKMATKRVAKRPGRYRYKARRSTQYAAKYYPKSGGVNKQNYFTITVSKLSGNDN